MTEHWRKANDAGAARTERKNREDKIMSDDEADLRRRGKLGKVESDERAPAKVDNVGVARTGHRRRKK